MFYTSIIEPPEYVTMDVGEATKTNKTLLYTIADHMIDPAIFPDKITWTGKSKIGEQRIAFNKFENIFKLVHAIMRRFDPAIKLEFVMSFFQYSIVKCSKKRQRRGEQVRRATGRIRRTKTNANDGDPADNIESEEMPAEIVEGAEVVYEFPTLPVTMTVVYPRMKARRMCKTISVSLIA